MACFVSGRAYQPTLSCLTSVLMMLVCNLNFQVQFSLLSMGKDQLEIKNICDSLGIRLIAYSPLGLGMLTGKYSPSTLPTGPRCVDT